jgi:hypothetical protein
MTQIAGLELDIRRCVRGHLGRRPRRAESKPVLPQNPGGCAEITVAAVVIALDGDTPAV